MDDALSSEDVVDGAVPESPERPSRLPYILFFATIGTTLLAGVQNSGRAGDIRMLQHMMGFDLSAAIPPWWQDPTAWLEVVSFSAAIMGILFAHEMGHYLTARFYNVKVSLPYFIPVPTNVGTLGAVIRMDLKKLPARQMMRIAAFGPFAGMVVALPVVILGLYLSEIREIPESAMTVELSAPLLMWAFEELMFPRIPEGSDIFLHPLAYAGWVGLLVTSINLLPIGQLDGGHVAYALFGARHNKVVRWFWVGLAIMGVLIAPNWLIFAAIIYFLIGIEHPPMLTDGTAQGSDRAIGWLAVLLFVLTFTPRPVLSMPSLLDLLLGS